MPQYATWYNQRVQVLRLFHKSAPVIPGQEFPKRAIKYAQIGYLEGPHAGETEEVAFSELEKVTNVHVSE